MTGWSLWHLGSMPRIVLILLLYTPSTLLRLNSNFLHFSPGCRSGRCHSLVSNLGFLVLLCYVRTINLCTFFYDFSSRIFCYVRYRRSLSPTPEWQKVCLEFLFRSLTPLSVTTSVYWSDLQDRWSSSTPIVGKGGFSVPARVSMGVGQLWFLSEFRLRRFGS